MRIHESEEGANDTEEYNADELVTLLNMKDVLWTDVQKALEELGCLMLVDLLAYRPYRLLRVHDTYRQAAV